MDVSVEMMDVLPRSPEPPHYDGINSTDMTQSIEMLSIPLERTCQGPQKETDGRKERSDSIVSIESTGDNQKNAQQQLQDRSQNQALTEPRLEQWFSRLINAFEKIAEKNTSMSTSFSSSLAPRIKVSESQDPAVISGESGAATEKESLDADKESLDARLMKLELAFDGLSEQESLPQMLYRVTTESQARLDQAKEEILAKIDAQLQQNSKPQSESENKRAMRGRPSVKNQDAYVKASFHQDSTPGQFGNQRKSLSALHKFGQVPSGDPPPTLSKTPSDTKEISKETFSSRRRTMGSTSSQGGRTSQKASQASGPRLESTAEEGADLNATPNPDVKNPKRSWGFMSSRNEKKRGTAIVPLPGSASPIPFLKHESADTESDAGESRRQVTFVDETGVGKLESSRDSTGAGGSSREVYARAGSGLNMGHAFSATESVNLETDDSFLGLMTGDQSTFNASMSDIDRPLGQAKDLRILPLHPDSRIRVALDAICMLVMLYDSIMIPFLLTWNPRQEEGGWLHMMAWTTLVFWTLDMCLGFVTGFYHNDQLVMHIPQIALHYLQTWLFVDICVVAADWVGLLLANSGEQQVVRIMRICKLNRLLRLVVMLKKSKFANLQEKVDVILMKINLTAHANYIGGLFKILVLILWLNHLGCCMWYVVGTDPSPRSEGDDWMTQLGLSESHEDDLSYSYLMGYYWSISSMIALEPGRLQPAKTSEVIFLTVFLLFSFFFASAVVSSLAAMLLDFTMQSQDMKTKLKMLRRFLIENKVKTSLALTVQSQIMERLNSRHRITEKDVTVLSLLSTSMRSQLRHNVYAPHMGSQHFFFVCDFYLGSFVRDLCFYAMRLLWPCPGEEMFAAETVALEAYFVNAGALQYVHAGSLGNMQNRLSIMASADDDEGLVEAGQWLCELALWMEWKHQGWLEALTDCEVLAISADGVSDVIGRYPELKRFAHHYGTSLNKVMRENSHDDLSDLENPVDHASVVMHMPTKFRVMMSMPVIEHVKKHSNTLFGRKSIDKLEEEVKLGKCDLIRDAGGRALRIVSVAVLNLEYRDKILVQLWEHGNAKASYTLPGTKLQVGEMPNNAVQRLMKKKMLPWKDSVHVIYHESNNDEKPSPSYGVDTRYVRQTFFAKIADDLVPTLQKVVVNPEGELLCEKRCDIGGPPIPLAPEALTALEPVLRKQDGTPIIGCNSTETTATELVTGSEIFCMNLNDDPNKFILYTWMSTEDFERLSSS